MLEIALFILAISPCPNGVTSVDHITDIGREVYCEKPSPSGVALKHGAYRHWFPNGQLQVEAMFDNRVPVGRWTYWYPDGVTQVMGDYKNGKPHGIWTWWHPNSRKKSEGQFSEGKSIGEWRYWDDKGGITKPVDCPIPLTSPTKATSPRLREPATDKVAGCDTSDPWANSPDIVIAATFGKINELMSLIKNGANVNAHNDYNSTALIMASAAGQTEAVTILIEAGSDTALVDCFGRTALSAAKENNRDDIVRIIEQANRKH